MVLWWVHTTKKARVRSSDADAQVKRALMCIRQKPLEEEEMVLMQSAFHHFTMTLKMLNETMAMCLPTSPEAVHWDPLPKYEMD